MAQLVGKTVAYKNIWLISVTLLLDIYSHVQKLAHPLHFSVEDLLTSHFINKNMKRDEDVRTSAYGSVQKQQILKPEIEHGRRTSLLLMAQGMHPFTNTQ